MPKSVLLKCSVQSILGLSLLVLGACSSDDSGPLGVTGGTRTSEGSGGMATTGGNTPSGGSAASTSGGSVGTGGANAAGGVAMSGGAKSTGGSATGGSNGAGGTRATGGTSSSGGTPSAGGASAAGGSTPSGGSTSPGGAASGGSNGAGGTRATGGASSSGGTPSTGGAGTTGGSTPSGGTSSGGASTGGVATGGNSAQGGTASGGASAGGVATGGSASGGNASGGVATGGTTATGGSGTGTPGVRIVGRTASGTAAGSVRFSWPGVAINARFTGTQVSMDLNDGSNKNRFTVVIDGGTPKTVTTSSATSLSIATGLSNGTHDLVIWRNTEPGMGVTQFVGLSNFGSGGALLAPPAAPDRRIEVIGDSLSVGAGVEGTSTSCSPSIDAFTNNYLAYGSVAARAVGADVVTIAWSGIGVYRSYSASDPTMPTRYPYSIPNDNTAWDFSLYQPQVVVFNLGTNDFGSGDPGTAYETAYVNFIKTVRSKYASANFILIDMYGSTRLTRINNVISTLKSGGESKVEMLSFSSVPNNNTACNQHPNATAQAAMGAILATRLRSLMGW